MNAREFLLRYDAGERDFQGVDLSGERLSQANLAGANLKWGYFGRHGFEWCLSPSGGIVGRLPQWG
ncbi:MAG: pentapeptide repeat-containing protein [Cyanobacteriota bacterium]